MANNGGGSCGPCGRRVEGRLVVAVVGGGGGYGGGGRWWL